MTTRFTKFTWPTLLLGGVLILTGCGGGGGGGGDNPGSGGTASLTDQNATSAITAGYSALGAVNFSSSIPMGVEAAGNNGTKVELLPIINVKIRQALRGGRSLSTLPIGVTTAVTQDCTYYDFQSGTDVVSGSMTSTYNVANPGALDEPATANLVSGDTLTMSFDNCAFYDAGLVLGGSANVTVTSTIDPSCDAYFVDATCQGSLSFNTTNLMLTVTGVGSVTMSGSYSESWTEIGTGTTYNQTDSITNGTFSLVVAPVSGSSETLSISNLNSTHSYQFDADSDTEHQTASATVSVPPLGTIGVAIDTTDTYTNSPPYSYTATGTITISGSNSSVRGTVNDTGAQIEVDANGDGTYESNLGTMTWEEIDAYSY